MSDIVSIANNCPRVYGPAVNAARALRMMYDDVEYYDNSICNPGARMGDDGELAIISAANTQLAEQSEKDNTVIEKDGIMLYPNPASNLVTIQFKRTAAYKIRVLNNMGSVIDEFDTNEHVYKISTEKYISGLYLVQFVNNEKSIETIKFSIIK